MTPPDGSHLLEREVLVGVRAVAGPDLDLRSIRGRAAGQIEAHLEAEPRGAKGPWWGRSDTKWVAEALWSSGVLTTATRAGFARHYDLIERVLPAEVLAREVSDDEAVRQGLRDLLEEEGYPAIGAADGREALALATEANTAPGLILLDLRMPVMDGWQFLAEWKRRKTASHCPVVLLSGLSYIQDAPGVADFLSKPVDRSRLLACVRRLYGPSEAPKA